MKKLKKIAIIHFQPIELYPPVCNFLSLLEVDDMVKKNCVQVFTNETVFEEVRADFCKISLKRWSVIGRKENRFKRFFGYMLFNFGTLFSLLRMRPSDILYYETYSSFPALIYCYIFRNCRLFVHYHEYRDKKWYRTGMKSVKWFHEIEKKICYNRAVWISHTNKDRMDFFLNDNNLNLDGKKFFIYPNYPPALWMQQRLKLNNERNVIKLVYVGSFGSAENLYIKEVLTWVKSMKSEVTLDVYSFNISKEIEEIIKEINAQNVFIHGPSPYKLLPQVLSQYDVGLIIYKGKDANFVYNEPNKLFEYLICGLDVWYPMQMIGCHSFDRVDAYPKIIRLNFENLGEYDVRKLFNRQGINKQAMDYTCENASAELREFLLTETD
jgi:hypothetical protein